MRVFVDANVLIDVLAQREPFHAAAARKWTLAESGRVEAVISTLSVCNCYYLVRKYSGKRNAEEAIRALRDVFTPCDLSAQVLNQAMDAGFSDLEDAAQFYSAARARAERVITRNPDHFPRTPLPVLSPAEFLAAYSFE